MSVMEITFYFFTKQYSDVIKNKNDEYNFIKRVEVDDIDDDVILVTSACRKKIPYTSTKYTSIQPFNNSSATIHVPSTHNHERVMKVWDTTKFPNLHIPTDKKGDYKLYVSNKTYVIVDYDTEETTIQDDAMVTHSKLLTPNTITLVGKAKGKHVNLRLITTKTLDTLVYDHEKIHNAWRFGVTVFVSILYYIEPK